MVKIIQDFITPGMRHRPMTNPASSLYKKKMVAQYITIHEAWSSATARSLHAYVKSQRAADRPASWHFSVDESEAFQALPLDESGWHAGDNLGPGNTTTIGIEICDYGMRRDNNWGLFLRAVDHTARICAHLIQTVPSLKPYPECLRLRQHWHWSGKNCPWYIRDRKMWDEFVNMVGDYLEEPEYKELNPGDEFWVIAGSYTVIENALSMQSNVRSQNFNADLRAVTINGTVFYRVVVGVYKHNQHKEALSLAAALRARGITPTILDIQKPPIVIEPTPPDEFPDDYTEGIDPDIDRDWIDKYKGKGDPYQDALPTGLLAILRALYQWLKAMFE